MSNELATANTFEEMSKIAGAIVKSGYFQDARDVSQAIVKILAGAEIGIGAFQSMQSIYIIQGRPSMSANLMASRVKASRRYNYRIVTLDDSACDILFLEDGKEAGHSVFTMKDAQKAGTKNLDKFPRNMLFARAMSNGVRWYCPDVLGSAPFYTPEELGADVAEDGTIVDVKPIVERPVVAHASQQTTQAQTLNYDVDENNNASQASVEAQGATLEITPMPYDMAKDFKNHEGTLYIDLDDKTLNFMASSLENGIRANKYANPDEAQQKLAAIRCILAKRASAK